MARLKQERQDFKLESVTREDTLWLQMLLALNCGLTGSTMLNHVEPAFVNIKDYATSSIFSTPKDPAMFRESHSCALLCTVRSFWKLWRGEVFPLNIIWPRVGQKIILRSIRQLLQFVWKGLKLGSFQCHKVPRCPRISGHKKVNPSSCRKRKGPAAWEGRTSQRPSASLSVPAPHFDTAKDGSAMVSHCISNPRFSSVSDVDAPTNNANHNHMQD